MVKQRNPIPKTQKEISTSLQTPYDVQQGNPNNAIPSPKNRSLQTSYKGDTTKPLTIGIQDIDEAVFYYLENIIKPTITHNGEQISVPVLYGSPEKWKSYQKDGYLRDLKGSLMAPLIVFKRTDIAKNRSITNKMDANSPNNYGVLQKAYDSRNAYDNFTVLNNRKPQKQYYAVVVPDYITVTYQFVLFTYYVEQLNKIVEAMEYASDAYWGNPERFKFKAMIDSFGFQTELNENAERVVRSTFNLTLNGYIIPNVIQKDTTAISKYSNKTQVLLSEYIDGTEDIPTPVIVTETSPSTTPLLLDTYSGAAAAYSLRLLSTSYTGAAIRVRRASDNTEQDIGFSNNVLDTTSLASFCSGTDGFVTTWYDQSGNGNDATQTTAAEQPQIYDSSTGVLIFNNKPYVNAQINRRLTTSYTLSQPYMIFAVARLTAAPQRLLHTPNVSFQHSNVTRLNAGVTLDANTAIDGTIQHIFTGLANGANSKIYYDGSQDASGDAGNSSLVDPYIFTRTTVTTSGTPYAYEMIIYASDQSSNRTGIETNINDFYSIY